MGGVRIDRDGFTNLEGLFAAGEDASGVHGANRLGGNGVAESTVFGARVGDAASRWIKTTKYDAAAADQMAAAQIEAERFIKRERGENPFGLREELGGVMWDRVGIVREGKELERALAKLNTLKERSNQVAVTGGRLLNPAWQEALDLRNLLTVSELITRAALERQESRGAHYRTDYPELDDVNWLKNIYLSRAGNEAKMWTQPVKLTRLAR
jgi:succinate dehydrogenase / fumarate reductase flavoprotein subunit/fumarate reductase flavoprotein subunit